MKADVPQSRHNVVPLGVKPEVKLKLDLKPIPFL